MALKIPTRLDFSSEIENVLNVFFTKEFVEDHSIQQHEWEMRVLLRLALDNLKPCFTVELGTYKGFAAALLSLITSGKTITVDSVDYNSSFAIKHGKNVESLLEDANRNETSQLVMSKLGGSIDLLFVDDGHYYDDLVRQYNVWSPHVRPGGWICFHDINPKANIGPGGVQPPCVQVPRFWSELREKKMIHMTEIIATPDNSRYRGIIPNGGIGILAV